MLFDADAATSIVAPVAAPIVVALVAIPSSVVATIAIAITNDSGPHE
jgi:hypothetical protein